MAVVVQLPIAVFLQGSASVDILVDYLLGIGASRGRFGYILGVNSVVGNLVSAIRQIEVSSLGGYKRSHNLVASESNALNISAVAFKVHRATHLAIEIVRGTGADEHIVVDGNT